MNQQRIISLLLLSGFILTTSAIAQDSKQEQKSDTPATNDIRERMRERRDEIRGDDKSKNNTNAPAVQANQPTADNRADEKTTEDGPPPSRRVNARDILDRMRSNRRESQPILPVRPGVTREQRVNAAPGAVPGNAVAPVNRKLRPDGSRLVDRAGRLTHSGDYLTFTFESRSEGTEELPLRLLPNRLLEDMQPDSITNRWWQRQVLTCPTRLSGRGRLSPALPNLVIPERYPDIQPLTLNEMVRTARPY